jgi:DNA-binding IclR family transcriptional regulator
VEPWSFLTNHARVLVCIAHDPGVRLRDIAERVGVTERTAYGIVTDLADAGYIIKEREGRRNRYQVQTHQPLPESTARETSIGEVLDLLVDRPAATKRRRRTRKK